MSDYIAVLLKEPQSGFSNGVCMLGQLCSGAPRATLRAGTYPLNISSIPCTTEETLNPQKWLQCQHVINKRQGKSVTRRN